MPSNLNYIIDQVGKDKGIDRKVIIEALEQAVLTASRKKYGHQGEIEVRYNEEAGEIELFQFKQVVEDVVDPPLPKSPSRRPRNWIQKLRSETVWGSS